ncbi:MAG: efflux transporter periplasmic adaptor subunit, partial [Acidobacteriota bacterium]|nr:efflux transporter periplasmic adaptor subunit [Acidobacteriota bacterium]
METGQLRPRLIWAALLAGLAALVAYALWPSPIRVETAQVTRGPFQLTIDQEGETRIHDRFLISAPIPGRLMRVDVEAGDAVRVNQIVARIDPLPLNQKEKREVLARVETAEANLRQAKAREARARASAEQARRDRDRAERLAREGVISAQALDQAKNADNVAAEELSAAAYNSEAAASDVNVARAGLVGIDTDQDKPRPPVQ